VNCYDIDQVTEAVRACDCFISGGGTMIGDELGLNFPLTHNARRIATAKYYGKGAVMMAIGANNLRTPEGRATARLLVGQSDRITVRDKQSFDVCARLGANGRKLSVTADPAFLLCPKETIRTRELKKRIRGRGKVIGVNVVNEAWAERGAYKVAIARACDFLSSRYGYFPFFFSNEVRPGKKYDHEANQQTAALLKCEHEVLDPIYYTPGEMMDIISSFDCIVAMRMHALIFAAVVSAPFVAVSRVDKVDNFVHLFGLKPGGSVDRIEAGDLIASVERVLLRWPGLKLIVERKVADLRKACEENAEVLGDVLSRRKTFRRRVSRASLKHVSSWESERRFKRNLALLMCGQLTVSQAVRKLASRAGFTRDGA
jgi:polysaccharide pyruvyl transferase WcaK-like protein